MDFNFTIVWELLLAVALALFGLGYIMYLNANRATIMMSDIALLFTILFIGGGSIVGASVDIVFFKGDVPWSYDLLFGGSYLFLGYLMVATYILGLMLSKVPFHRKRMQLNPLIGPQENQVFFFTRRALDIPPLALWVAFGLVWFFRVMQFASGGGISGLNSFQSAMALPYPVVVAMYLFGPFEILVLGYAVAKILVHRKYLFVLIIFSEIGFNILQGRREVLFVLFFVIIFYFAIRRTFRLGPLILGGTLGALFLFAVSPFFLSVRSDAQRIKQLEGGSGLSAYISAVAGEGKMTASEGDDEFERENAMANLSPRSRMNLVWIMNITHGAIARYPMFGESIFHGVMSALPRKFRPYRFWGDHASSIQMHFGLPFGDVADNYIASGVADFWLIGPLIFGFLFGCLLNFFGFVAVRRFFREPLLSALLFCYLFLLATDFESSLSTIFVILRNIIIVFVLIHFMRRMGFSFGRHKQPRSGRTMVHQMR